MIDFQIELFKAAVQIAEDKGSPISDTDLYQQHAHQWEYRKFNEIRMKLIGDGTIKYNDDDKLVMVKR